MSVEKFIISKDENEFSIIPNKVSQGLNYNLSALGLYLYIYSLPPNWIFYKSQLREACNIGTKKLNLLLKVLEDHGLLHIVQIRDEKGRFVHSDMRIKSGNNFINKDLIRNAPEGHFCHTVENGATVKNTYKENKYKTNILNNKNKHSCATDIAQTRFDEFWKNYPVKKNKNRTKKIWDKKRYDEIASIILEDLKTRSRMDHQWQDKQFIPHPSTYLNGELWQDEIVQVNTKIKKLVQSEYKKPIETHSAVKEWGPGNPGWESLHGVKINEQSQGSDTSRDQSRRNGVHKAEGYLL